MELVRWSGPMDTWINRNMDARWMGCGRADGWTDGQMADSK